MVNYVLFETALGYALFERLQSEEIGAKLEQVQNSVEDLVKFGKTVKLKAFNPFKSSVHALENANDISEGIVNDHLKVFLEMYLGKPSKKKSKNNVVLGVIDKTLAGSIKSELGYECETSELVLELVRGIRLHSDKLLNQVKDHDLVKAQLGLGHSYSRAKVKFNVNRADNMIIQAISVLDQLDKDVNTFAMRVREWYSWHFPELVKIVNDNYQYARLAQFIKDKSELTEEQMDGLIEITGDESKAKQILDAAKASMGTDISELDMINIVHFTDRLIKLADYRKNMYEYLLSKMHKVAPNLSALIGEVVGARLISHAGSLTNLSKYPASTVQILGAEKALFRALKTKGNTPKYGLLYHSSFIGRAGAKNKGKISRFLANKCTIASRIDCFSDKPTSKFGEALKGQVEERLSFYENGSAVSKNLDVITRVIKELDEEIEEMEMDVDKGSGEETETVLGKRKASPESPEILPKKHKKVGGSNDEDETSKSAKKKKNKKKNKKDVDTPKETPKETPKSEKKVKFVLKVPPEIEIDEEEEDIVVQETSKSSKKKKDKKGEETPIKKKEKKEEATPTSKKEKKEKKEGKEEKEEKEEATPTKKKEKKEEVTLIKKKEKKDEGTPKSDKKKKDKKGEVTSTNETSKSDKKKKSKEK